MHSPFDKRWLHNEFKHVGADYASPVEVAEYDARHSKFRDFEKENNAVLDAIGAETNHVLLDFGSGTGTFAIQAARRCARVIAVDVSPAMLEYAKGKAAKAGAANIEFLHGGFLTHACPDDSLDRVTTTFAFHHLPDYWKGVALKRLRAMLKPGGILYMHDVVIEEQNSLENIAALIQSLGELGGESLREDTEAHFRDEYSTYDWVMDGLFTRAGFVIQEKSIKDGVLATYLCAKP